MRIFRPYTENSTCISTQCNLHITKQNTNNNNKEKQKVKVIYVGRSCEMLAWSSMYIQMQVGAKKEIYNSFSYMYM